MNPRLVRDEQDNRISNAVKSLFALGGRLKLRPRLSSDGQELTQDQAKQDVLHLVRLGYRWASISARLSAEHRTYREDLKKRREVCIHARAASGALTNLIALPSIGGDGSDEFARTARKTFDGFSLALIGAQGLAALQPGIDLEIKSARKLGEIERTASILEMAYVWVDLVGARPAKGKAQDEMPFGQFVFTLFGPPPEEQEREDRKADYFSRQINRAIAQMLPSEIEAVSVQGYRALTPDLVGDASAPGRPQDRP
jgi:hypothetical protein